MGQKIDLTTQVQGILPEINGGAGQNSGVKFADAETPSGAVNGTNTNFLLTAAPNPTGSLILFLNKVLQLQGVDYTLSGNIINMSVAPLSVSSFVGWYRYKGFVYGIGLQDSMLQSEFFLFDVLAFSLDTSVSDQLVLSDSNTLAKILRSNASIAIEDTIVMNDRIVATTPISSMALSDSLTQTDAIVARATLPFVFVESLTLVDPITGYLSQVSSFMSDRLTYVDSLLLGLSGSLSDQMTQSDAVVVVKS